MEEGRRYRPQSQRPSRDAGVSPHRALRVLALSSLFSPARLSVETSTAGQNLMIKTAALVFEL
jgi:hypothetical protein